MQAQKGEALSFHQFRGGFIKVTPVTDEQNKTLPIQGCYAPLLAKAMPNMCGRGASRGRLVNNSCF